MGLWNLLWGRRAPDVSRTYTALVAAARALPLYEAGAPDTLDGRFDMLVLHLHLVLRRLRVLGQDNNPESHRFAQALFDHFFQNMDETLREMGVGDTSVGKRIRKMAQAYYGRAKAYDIALSGALSASSPDQIDKVAVVLARNLYPDCAPDSHTPPSLARLATYIISFEAGLGVCSLAQISAGSVPNISP
ncbi:MAG: ubiquinol-cytochrome C chaperone [Alphaproteobacteria bacterium]|nr:ubiquinol-cytochrome C chaperone [Alphaproteobacteria bacterium]